MVLSFVQLAAKGALFLGIVLLLGEGGFARWIAPDVAAAHPRIRTAAWAGAVLVCAGSALEVVDTISRAAGSVDASLVLPYLSDTRHGNAVAARLAIVALLVVVGTLRGRWRPGLGGAAFVALGAALLATQSLVSHAGAQSGFLPVTADLVHLAGVAAWGGALLYGAWLIPWRASGAAARSAGRAVHRVSAVGAWAVAAIVATGVYASVRTLWGPQALLGTPYGRALLIKLAFVVMVLSLAAVNRWIVIPSLDRRSGTERLGGPAKAESLLLVAVLGTTAALVSQSPPGPPPTLSRPLTFQDAAGSWTVRGTIARRDPGRFAVEMTLSDAARTAAPAGIPVRLTLTMLEHEMTPVDTTLAEIRPGAYRGTFFLPMTGQWQMTIRAGAGVARVPIQTEDAVFIQTASPWRVVLPGAGVVLAGLAFLVAGLQRLGAGARGSWPAMGAGTMLLIAGLVMAVRAVG